MKVAKVLTGKALDEPSARERVERLAREVLSNPVIEDYRVEL